MLKKKTMKFEQTRRHLERPQKARGKCSYNNALSDWLTASEQYLR